MSELSEEEIIKILKHVIEPADIEHMSFYEIYGNYVPLPKLNEAIQGLLALYQKEKEKNEKAIEMLKEEIHHCENENAEMYDKCHIQLKFNRHLLKLLEERN